MELFDLEAVKYETSSMKRNVQIFVLRLIVTCLGHEPPK